jgi:hypothetical protein
MLVPHVPLRSDRVPVLKMAFELHEGSDMERQIHKAKLVMAYDLLSQVWVSEGEQKDSELRKVMTALANVSKEYGSRK